MTKTCEACSSPLQTRRRDARFCCDRCRKKAARRRTPAEPGPTREWPLAELDAALELVRDDHDDLARRFPPGTDEVVDEVLAGLECLWRFLEQLHTYLTKDGA